MDADQSHTMVTTLCAAVAAGIFLTVLCRRLKLPAIILLLAGGVGLGPEGLGIVRPDSLGDFLPVVVSLAVGLILFEGGLTLDIRGFSQGSRVIKRLLTSGVLVTWLLSALCVGLVFGAHPSVAILCGSLVIVTGPTVIVPLLKRIKVNAKLHGILHWEGVLIDSIGVFIALLCFEWILGAGGGSAVANFGVRTLVGLGMGGGAGWLTAWLLRTQTVPEDMKNIFTLAAAVAIFGATEAVISEGGLLSVTIAGLIVGWKQPIGLKRLREFKGEITDLLIGLLFILLAARLRFEQFTEFGLQGALAVALIMLVVRPANILVSSWGSDLTGKEKLFLSWVAPRGIVAASMSSLFAMALARDGTVSNPKLIETFTYSVIVGTVVLQGLSAGLLARVLNLGRPVPSGWLIVGAHALGRQIAKFIQEEAKLNVLLIDSNPRQVKQAQSEGLPALCADAADTAMAEERPDFQRIRYLLALTDNSELNEILCHRWGDILGREHVMRWSAVKSDISKSDSTHGVMVFPDLPRPSTISDELLSGHAKLETMALESKSAVTPGQIIFAARPGQAIPATSGSGDKIKPKDRLLMLGREAGLLALCFGSGDVIDFLSNDLQEVFEQVQRNFRQRFDALRDEPLWGPPNGAENHLLTLPGRGAALARSESKKLKQPICILARLGEGVEAPNQPEKTRLVFFLITPAEDAVGQIAITAELGRFCANPRNMETLQRFSKTSEALAFLRKQRGV